MSANVLSTGELWNQVRQLPSDEQFSFATRILQTLQRDSNMKRPPPKSFADLAGIMATEQPPPSDEEIDQILDEERQRKFR